MTGREQAGAHPRKVRCRAGRSSLVSLVRHGTHLAGSLIVPPRHGGRQAHLHRPVPERQPEVPGERAQARARRHHRAHAWSRRPRRRHGRDREEARLDRRRAWSSSQAGSASRASTRASVRNPNKGGTDDVDGVEITLVNAHHSGSRAGRLVCGRAGGDRRRDRGRQVGLLRRRHVRLRRHAAHRPDLQARRRRPSDRRPLHDGAARGVGRDGAARRQARACRATGAHSALLTGTPDQLDVRAGVTLESWSPAARSRYEGALVRRDRQARSGARARGGGGRRGALVLDVAGSRAAAARVRRRHARRRARVVARTR